MRWFLATLVGVSALTLWLFSPWAIYDVQIYQGSLVLDGQYVAIAGLTYVDVRSGKAERTPRCSGTLIAPNVVLTAGHCLCEAWEAGYKLNAVYFGTDPAKVDQSSVGYYFPVKNAWPRYSCKRPADRNGSDLAIVLLDRKVTGIKPVAFAPDALFASATTARIAGFGATDASGTVNDFRKRQADLKIASIGCTSAPDHDTYGCIISRELRAGALNTADTCSGDSGAPLLVNRGGTKDTLDGNDLLLLGVTSRSVPTKGPVCGVGGIYERIDANAQAWISSKLSAI